MKKHFFILILLLSFLGFSQTTSGEYTIINLESNSKNSDFGVTYQTENKVYFASSRGGGKKWDNKEPFLDLFEADVNTDGSFTKISKLPSTINGKYHESSVSFSPNKKTVYFTKNNSIADVRLNDSLVSTTKRKDIRQAKKDEKERQKTSYFLIYRADVDVNGKWINITSLPFNNRNYSVGHPSVSRDGSKLYFASDMPGAYGSSDIFVVDILANGKYSKPRNLGRKINTLGREAFPYIDSKNNLYFSSDSKKDGYGGLDIYAVKVYEDNTISNALHLGNPINSENDDFGYALNNNIDEGYFSSNREGGKGSDDIYHLSAEVPLKFECTQFLTGTVKNTKNGKPISKTTVTLYKENGDIIAETITNGRGLFKFDVPCDAKLKITANKVKFEDDFEEFTTNDKQDHKVTVSLQLKPIIICKQSITGNVKNVKTGKSISKSDVTLYNDKGEVLAKTVSNNKGNFRFDVTCDTNFKITATKSKFESDFEELLTNNNLDENTTIVLQLTPIIICKQNITGVVKHAKTGEPISNAFVQIIDSDGKDQNSLNTNDDGKFNLTLPCLSSDYTFTANKIKFMSDTREVRTKKKPKSTLELIFNLKPEIDTTEVKILRNKVFVNIDPIYFELNKDDINIASAIELDKVVSIMKKYPNLKIEGGSHTDSRSTDSYNYKLSDRRASSTVNYIISNGISSDRISAKGYGESQLINHCADGVKCSKKEHAVNRRTEFVILNPEVLGYIEE